MLVALPTIIRLSRTPVRIVKGAPISPQPQLLLKDRNYSVTDLKHPEKDFCSVIENTCCASEPPIHVFVSRFLADMTCWILRYSSMLWTDASVAFMVLQFAWWRMNRQGVKVQRLNSEEHQIGEDKKLKKLGGYLRFSPSHACRNVVVAATPEHWPARRTISPDGCRFPCWGQSDTELQVTTLNVWLASF